MRQTKLALWGSSSLLIAYLSMSLCFAQTQTEKVTLAEGTVLRLALSARTPIGHVGQPVEADVIEPVYSFDEVVIPAKSRVFGTVTALNPVSRGERILAMTGGDFTPFHDPEIQFDRLQMPDGRTIDIDTAATNRNTNVVAIRDRNSKGASLMSTAKNMARERLGFGSGPKRMDLIRNELFSYLPYHPQALDRGSLLDAVLVAPLDVEVPESDPVDISHLGEAMPPDTLLHARLLTEMSSDESRQGMPIEAVLTEPVWGPDQVLLFPEGTQLLGSVVKAKPAGWFGRSGELRFVFNALRLPSGSEEKIQGRIEALESRKGSNVTLDAEGGTRARMNNRFISPMINAALATMASQHGGNRIKRAVVSDGFRIVGRIAGFTGTQEISMTLSYYGMARSLYLNFVQKGQNAAFPANTRLEIRVNQRPELQQ